MRCGRGIANSNPVYNTTKQKIGPRSRSCRMYRCWSIIGDPTDFGHGDQSQQRSAICAGHIIVHKCVRRHRCKDGNPTRPGGDQAHNQRRVLYRQLPNSGYWLLRNSYYKNPIALFAGLEPRPPCLAGALATTGQSKCMLVHNPFLTMFFTSRKI